MAEPTRDDVDALVGPATPHFAYQLRARVRELVSGLPEGHEVRRYAETQIERLDRLGHASSKADEGPRDDAASATLLAHPSIFALDLYPEDLGALMARRDELYANARSVLS